MKMPWRILFCSPHRISSRLGASKVYVEVADALASLGWKATVVGPEEIGASEGSKEYPRVLRSYLRNNAGQFDVVEYEHNRLPFPRSDFEPKTLFVARSVLLSHHFLTTPIPPRPRLRSRLAHFLLGDSLRRSYVRIVADAIRTCHESDLVNVPTADDVAALVGSGIPDGKVLIVPFALTIERRNALARSTIEPLMPIIAFIGTFDPRKGMADFPGIVARVSGARPDVQFRLLGTAGMISDAAGVLGHFPRALRDRIEVVPEFDPAALPKLLAGCSVGMFPSAIEGFPFGVLEMLAAGVPVVAYRVPGPSAILADENLVPRGDTEGMALRLLALLEDPARLTAARTQAIVRAGEFSWDDIARRTAARYELEVCARRSGVCELGVSLP